jgi:predicted RNA-binding protein with TRAM domain
VRHQRNAFGGRVRSVARRSKRLESSDELLCLFSASLSKSEDGNVIELPSREVEAGPVEAGERYRIALIRGGSGEPTTAGAGATAQPQPPVEPGEMRYVEVEDLGKQGDGIARVERGYVIIVPDTEVGDRVKIEITDVEPNFAVGDVVESA